MKHSINLVFLVLFALVHCLLVEGRKVTFREFPYVVQIGQGCGEHFQGSIIHEYFVLTAARRLFKFRHVKPISAKLLQVIVGYEKNKTNGTEHKIERVIVHPDYKNLPTLESTDVALIKLRKPIPLGKKIKAIPLSDVNPSPSQKGWNLSYGKTTVDDKFENRYLNAVELTMGECYESWKKKKIVICSKPEGTKSACDGDSGAPYVIDQKLVGIAFAYSGFCGEENSTIIFTSVPDHKTWIESTMKENLPSK